MDWLNYHHLLYFWTVGREGTIASASKRLRLAQPTISGQIRRLEEALGEKLFVRKGRHLVLTDVGRVVFRYAGEIFALGRELQDAVAGRAIGRPLELVVGVADVLPKSIARLLLAPALALGEKVRLVCREDRPVAAFVAELAVHELDLVLSDAPVEPSLRIKAFSHLLGDCGTTFLAAPKLAASLRRSFPRSLDRAPCLLPGAGSTLRRSLEDWFHAGDLRPDVIGEFDDPALANLFAEDAIGVVAVPSVIEDDLGRRHGLHVVGRSASPRHRFYAISVERRLRHPAVVAIRTAARKELFR